MILNIETPVCGLFRFEAFKVDNNGHEIKGTRRIVADWFPNLITNNGLELLGTSGTWLSWCQIGSGNTTPAFADTALSSRMAGTNTRSADQSGTQSSEPYFVWRRNTYRFAEGVAAGNISEVGVGPSSTANLLSRALILDSSGNPTTITVLSDETLDVSYEFRYYAPPDDISGTITLAGIDYTFTGRASLVATNSTAGWSIGATGQSSDAGVIRATNGTIGSITGRPSGTSSAASVTTSGYSAGTQRRDGTATWALGAGNLSGGISAVSAKLGIGTYQFGFSPAIPKDSTKILTLTFRHSWSRKTL